MKLSKELLDWLEEQPDLIASLNERRDKETEPKLEKASPPHYRTIEYFWFDGSLYRREGFGLRDDNLWERYKEDPLGDKRPWWVWEAVGSDLTEKLEKAYRKLT